MLFVTGITGHSGRYFYERLVEEHYDEKVIVYVRQGSDTGFLSDASLQLEICYGDLNDKEALSNAMQGSDTVLHIAHIDYTPKIMKAAIENHVDWVILVHTTGRFSKYKSAAENYIKIEEQALLLRNQIDITVVRPTMIYGSNLDRNMMKLIRFLDKCSIFPIFGKGDNLMQPVHAVDLGNAYCDIIKQQKTTRNKEYNLSGDQPMKYIDLIKEVAFNLDKKVHFIMIPFSLSLMAARVYNRIFGKYALITVEQVLRMQEDKAFSHEQATNDFGYRPMSFQEGIKREISEYRKMNQ